MNSLRADKQFVVIAPEGAMPFGTQDMPEEASATLDSHVLPGSL